MVVYGGWLDYVCYDLKLRNWLKRPGFCNEEALLCTCLGTLCHFASYKWGLIWP